MQELDLTELKEKAAKQHVPPISVAYVYAPAIGPKEHSPRLVHLRYEPDFDFLRSDERYREIVRKVGLPPAF